MRLLNELRLGRNILDTIAIPMMPSAGDEILRMQVGRVAWGCKIRVVAYIEPNVDVLENRQSVPDVQCRGMQYTHFRQ